MPEACPNYWQMYECEWGIRYLWHWTNPYARLDLVVLALLLAYILPGAPLLAFEKWVSRTPAPLFRHHTPLNIRFGGSPT